MPRTLTDEDVQAIAAAVFGRIKATLPATDLILTRAEARHYVKRHSDRAFARWCKKWGVRSVVHGRYSRSQLDLALSREATLRR